MGNLATPEFLLARWEELCRDPSLQDLPYKIELNAWGKVEMSPPGVGHARLQAAVAAQLTQQLPDGVTLTECPVLTGIGVRAPDIAWASNRFRKLHKGLSEEVWLVAETGSVRFIDRTGEISKSRFPVALSLPDVTTDYP